MLEPLRPHPSCTTIAESLDVSIEWETAHRLWLRYHIEVSLDDLALPDPGDAVRTDDLWRTTCCELFLRVPGGDAYCEFNFSPSSQWAAYRFAQLRNGMALYELPRAPEIHLDASESHFALEAMLTLPPSLAENHLLAAIAAVIEASDGTKSYWGLAHPPGDPDFHHPDCFALDLAPLERP